MKTVMICGTFDIVHVGHIHMFKQAREYGDKLVVVVARDANVERIKGVGPFHDENERVDFLRNITLVDEVLLGGQTDPHQVVCDVNPDIVALGYDQKVFVDELAARMTSCGMNTQIVRLTPHKQERYKSGNIKKYMQLIV